MTKTFKQFLEDIHVDPEAFTKDASTETAGHFQASWKQDRPGALGPGWKRLPVSFPVRGFEVFWQKSSTSGNWNICLVDTRDASEVAHLPGSRSPTFTESTNRLAVAITAEPVTDVHLQVTPARSTKLNGIVAAALYSSEDYRGQGLASLLYEALVKGGQVFFSSHLQTPGGAATWKKLVRAVSTFGDVGAIVESYHAEEIIKRHSHKNAKLVATLKDHTGERTVSDAVEQYGTFLVVGDLPVLEKEVYSQEEAVWVVGPRGSLGRYLPMAVKV